MKKMRNLLAVMVILTGLLTTNGCKKESPPTLTTAPLSDITLVSARSGGSITDDGGAAISARGVCWSLDPEPTISNNRTSDGTGAGDFTSQITDLSDGTTYFVRAYATNSEGTSYGNEEVFSTVAAGLPTVTTKAITDLTFTSAKSGGDITSDGGASVTAKGICWHTAENPTVANSFSTDGQGTAGFITEMTNLAEGTTYFVRAYATNKAGTTYGNQVTFVTPQRKAPELTTSALTSITPTSAVSGGTITYNGGDPVTVSGLCWSTVPHPTVANTKTTNGTATGSFASNITGLANGTVYYVRSYATNSIGTGYGNEYNFITPVADVEGNIYKTVAIGQQVWMAENLKTIHYTNNTLIPNVRDSLTWMGLTSPAYSWYRNNAGNKDRVGALYNWFAASSGALCPTGWRVPSNSDWQSLELQLGISPDSIFRWGWRGPGIGTSLKSTAGWNTEGQGTNSSGMNIIAAGFRAWSDGSFRAMGDITYFWSTTDDAINNKPTVAWYRRLDYSKTRVYQATSEKQGGKSIRCLKNR